MVFRLGYKAIAEIRCVTEERGVGIKGDTPFLHAQLFSLFLQDISGLQDHEFRTRFPESPALLYQVRLGDEKLQVCIHKGCQW